MLATCDTTTLRLPGFASAHSHAFQRAMRSRTQRKIAGVGSFWSWRTAMYDLASSLSPDSLYHIARMAYAELAMAGVTAVGEFHYVHHQADGTPYEDRVVLADAVLRAAVDVGIRIGLMRVVYQRAGANRPPEPQQRRFCDERLEDAFDDVDLLIRRWSDHPLVSIGIAAHSVRAVSRPAIREIARFAGEREIPLHMHVAEQPREIEENIAENGLRPVEMLAEDGVLGERFVAVHGTHLNDAEVAALGSARSFVCICRTTERDLGDGLCRAGDLFASGARICMGVDSYAISDPFEEARAVELDERVRTMTRTAAADASSLLEAGTHNGYLALGMPPTAADRLVLDAEDPALFGVTPETADDWVVFAASPRCLREVWVNDCQLVDGGVHLRFEEIAAYARPYFLG